MKPIPALAAFLLASCTTQADMDAQPAQQSFSMPMNYQQAYANLNKGARNCYAGTTGFVVDGQLYPDLGYGEVSAGSQSLVYMPIMEARVAKAGEASQVTVKATGLAANTFPKWVKYWTSGGITCPKVHFSEEPPS